MARYALYWDDTDKAFKQDASVDLDSSGYFVTAYPKVKAATEPVTSSSNLQDDDELTQALPAGSYEVECVLFYDGANNGDLKFELNGPPNGSRGVVDGLNLAATSLNDYRMQVYDDTAGSAPITVGTVAGNVCVVRLTAYFVTASAITAKIRWAQGASHSTATRVLTGSYLVFRKVA